MKYDVKIFPQNHGNIRAYASVNIEESFAITGVRILEGNKGLFVAMPSNRMQNGEYKDVCFPITKQAREELHSAVLNQFHQTMEQKQNQPKPQQQQQGQYQQQQGQYQQQQGQYQQQQGQYQQKPQNQPRQQGAQPQQSTPPQYSDTLTEDEMGELGMNEEMDDALTEMIQSQSYG